MNKKKARALMTQTLEVSVKVTVRKTGKSYRRTMNYAKHLISGIVGEPKQDEYFLRQGRGWKKVSGEEFKKATSKEAVRKLHEQLENELRQRVERIMSEKSSKA